MKSFIRGFILSFVELFKSSDDDFDDIDMQELGRFCGIIVSSSMIIIIIVIVIIFVVDIFI